ncbi:GNAT family N-acetyltransferase [Anaerotignum sp.]|nr:GNAT family N-acetyltransferase [Anaerotignum sp.]MBQ7757616.1 GNAT family N-acetyltransferase [Anaerotignum sp.]
MASVRVAKIEHKADFYRLWKVCFGDSDAFCDWFFENRFAPDYSVVLETDGEIASCMQAFPYTLRIRGKEIPGAMLCGVSTHPSHRKKGFMGQIFSYEMNHLREMGCVVAPHTPAVLPSYFSFGHLPVADAKYLECDCISDYETSVELVSVEEMEWNKLFPLYTRFAVKYSGIIQRTEADFLRKAADYAADGGKCAAYIKNGEWKGYAFYYQTEDTLLCVEAVAEEGYYHYLMEGLFAIGKGLAFSAKLPPELYLSYPFAKLTRKQKGVMGLCKASALLKALELDIPYGIKINDHVVPENNGTFDFKGNIYASEPVFEISAGHLLQVLVGYHTLNELRKEIVIFDEEKFEVIDTLLPKQNCYIIDEY